MKPTPPQRYRKQKICRRLGCTPNCYLPPKGRGVAFGWEVRMRRSADGTETSRWSLNCPLHVIPPKLLNDLSVIVSGSRSTPSPPKSTRTKCPSRRPANFCAVNGLYG